MYNWWQLVLGFVSGVCVCWLLHLAILHHEEANQAKALAEQQMKLRSLCLADKAITKGIDDAYELKATDLSRRINAMCLQPSDCIPLLPAKPAVGTHAAPARSGHAQQNGITRATLLSFAGECEGYRLQLISLQDFVNQTWKVK